MRANCALPIQYCADDARRLRGYVLTKPWNDESTLRVRYYEALKTEQ